jgi:Tfp pilus assembly protein PilV
MRLARGRAPFDSGGPARGAALVEAVVAVGVLTVAMASLTQLAFAALTRSEMAQQGVAASLLAQELIEDMLANRQDLAAWEGRTVEACERDSATDTYVPPGAAGKSFRWTWSIEPVDGAPRLRRLTVTVRYQPAGARGAMDEEGDQRAGLCAGGAMRGRRS